MEESIRRGSTVQFPSIIHLENPVLIIIFRQGLLFISLSFSDSLEKNLILMGVFYQDILIS